MKSTHYRIMLVTAVFAVWIWSAIDPLSYKDWLLENVLFIAMIPAIYYFGRKFNLTNISFTLIAIYIIIHLIGSHYTYGKVPIGFEIADWLGSERNVYDRIVHFAFGLLIFLPVRQIYVKLSKPEGFFSYFFPFLLIVAAGALYEIGEWMVAAFTSFRVASEFIAAQGDFFDAQKDMLMVMVGAVIPWTLILVRNIYLGKQKVVKTKSSVQAPPRPHPQSLPSRP